MKANNMIMYIDGVEVKSNIIDFTCDFVKQDIEVKRNDINNHLYIDIPIKFEIHENEMLRLKHYLLKVKRNRIGKKSRTRKGAKGVKINR